MKIFSLLKWDTSWYKFHAYAFLKLDFKKHEMLSQWC